MGCGNTKSNSSARITQLRPFPVGNCNSDSKSKLPNEAVEGFGNILKNHGSPYKPTNDLRKKPGKFEPGTNVYSNVIKHSETQSRIMSNQQRGSIHFRLQQGYNL